MKVRSRLLAHVAAALAAVLLLAGCTGSDAVDQNSFQFGGATGKGGLISQGDRKSAEDITGTLLDGGKYDLAASKGKVVVMNFWATWCGPCTTETPQFDLLYRQDKSKGVTFVGINTKNAPSGEAKAFVEDNDISYPIVYDEEGEIALRLGNLPIAGLPITVVIDKQGRVAAVYLTVLTPTDLTPVLKKLTAET